MTNSPLTPISFLTVSDVVLDELPNRGSRDEVVIASGAGKLQVGTVLGQVQSGKFIQFDRTASDLAAGVAACILLQYVDATSADVTAVVLSRVAQVAYQALIWPTSTTAGEKAAAIKELGIHEIVVRIGV